MGPDTYGERMSLRGDDTIRTNIAQESSLEEVGLQQGLEGKVGLEFWGEKWGGRVYGRQRGGCRLGKASVGRRMNCLKQVRRPCHLSWEPPRAKGWRATC